MKHISFCFFLSGCGVFLSGCGGGVHVASGGLDIIERSRKAGVVVIGGTRHVFDGPVDMEEAERIAWRQCKAWNYDNIEISSAKNTGSANKGENVGAALGTILGGHSPAGPVRIVYECY